MKLGAWICTVAMAFRMAWLVDKVPGKPIAREIAVGLSDGSLHTVEIKFWCVQKWIRE